MPDYRRALLTLFFMLSSAAEAAEYFTTLSGRGILCTQTEPCNLYYALRFKAQTGDTVYLAEGNYTRTSSPVVQIANSVSIIGGWDGNGSSTLPVVDPDNHVSVIDGEGAHQCITVDPQLDVNIENVVIANCFHDDNGSALYDFNASSLALHHVDFLNNYVSSSLHEVFGGALYVRGGSIDINDSVFENNRVHADWFPTGGGAAFSDIETVQITNSSFKGNAAYLESAFHVRNPNGHNGTVNVSHCRFEHNGIDTMNADGNDTWGAFYLFETIFTNIEVNDSLFNDNAMSNSNGVRTEFGSLFFHKNVISQNRTTSPGVMHSGFIYANQTDSTHIVNNLFTQNFYHGKIPLILFDNVANHHPENFSFVNNTIAENNVSAAIKIDKVPLTVQNNIIADVPLGIQIDNDQVDLNTTLWYNVGTDVNGTGTVIRHNDLTGDPRFVDPANGDYHLQNTSPAIDAGHCIPAVATDLENTPRPQGDGCDIGAYEHTKSTTAPAALLMYLLN